MNHWIDLFGPELQTKNGKKPTDQVLANKKIVGIYYSAHWCAPCKAFTPILSATYDDLVDVHDDVEIVFTSWDRDVTTYDEYYGEIPFKAVPFENSEVTAALAQKFSTFKIPTVLFLNAHGELVTKEGRQWIEDTKGDVEELYKKLTAQ